MILGLASFKKLLGFLAIVIPGLIGFFKLCKPQLYSTSFGNGHAGYYQQPQYTPAGVASGSPQYYSHHVPYNPNSYREDNFDYTGYNSNVENTKSSKSSSSVAFRDDAKAEASEPTHELAYSAYRNFRNS